MLHYIVGEHIRVSYFLFLFLAFSWKLTYIHTVNKCRGVERWTVDRKKWRREVATLERIEEKEWEKLLRLYADYLVSAENIEILVDYSRLQ